MKIAKITFTGADDKTDPKAMLDISRQYPQVEWGILFSRGNMGARRYPKWPWIDNLVAMRGFGIADEITDMALSAHLCGQYVRDVLAGNFDFLSQPWTQAFRRFQVNFHGEKVEDPQAFLEKLAQYDAAYEWILQMDGVNDDIYWGAKAQSIRVFPLFDRSGGEGITPKTWPAPTGDFCGYAGGLGPHNLAEQLKNLDRLIQGDTIWIDFETHVRNDEDDFDFDKIKECLGIAEPYLLGG